MRLPFKHKITDKEGHKCRQTANQPDIKRKEEKFRERKKNEIEKGIVVHIIIMFLFNPKGHGI